MIFLVRYRRRERRVVELRQFPDARRREAALARLDLELELNRNQIDDEVVLLEAADEQSLHRTHGRYFEELDDLLKAVGLRG